MAFVLVVVLLCNRWGPPELAFLVMLATCIGAIWRRGPVAIRMPIWCVAPLFAVVVLGCHGYFAHPITDASKDAWYALKPCVALAFGAVICARPDKSRILRAIVIAGVISSIVYCACIVISWDTYTAMELDARRHRFGATDFLPVLSLVLILHRESRKLLRNKFPIPRWILGFWALIDSVCILAYQSRTMYVGVALVLLLEFLRLPPRSKASVALGAVVLAGLFVALDSFTDRSSWLLGKLGKTKQEIAIEEYTSDQDINDNWRGFEAFAVLREFDRFDASKKAVGGGFGQKVRLGITIVLDDKEWEEIPIFHNGFSFVLVKSGLFGLFLFLTSLIALFVTSLKAPSDDDLWLSRAMPFWLVANLVFATAFLGGVYNKNLSEPLLVLVGAVLGRRGSTEVVSAASRQLARISTIPAS